MKLTSIKKIKEYKSFQDFTWQSFLNNQKFHKDLNILFGENGSGKSAICNIIKNVLQGGGIGSIGIGDKNIGYKSFGNNKPKEVILEFDIGECKYNYTNLSDQNFTVENDYIDKCLADNFWDKKLNTNDAVLFFDREFIAKHIHLGHARGTKKGQQEQESGDMIIQFDKEAINLRSTKQKLKDKKDAQEKIPQKFIDDNRDILDFSLSDEDRILFEKFKDKTKEDLQTIESELEKSQKIIEKNLEIDQVSQKKIDGIQNSIEEIKRKEFDISLSAYDEYQSIFNFDLKEQVKIEAEINLIKNLQFHKDFFETGFEVRKTHPNQCPFCQSRNEEENITKIIKAYNEIFDDTYKKQSHQFINDKQKLINELDLIKKAVSNIDLSSIFFELKKLDENYRIKNIYFVNDEKAYKKPPTKKIDDLIYKISKLKKPNTENIRLFYEEVDEEFKVINKFFTDISRYVEEKNKIILKFKLDNTNKKLNERIQKNTIEIGEFKQQIIFFNQGKIECQKRKEQKCEELGIIKKKVLDTQKEYASARIEYENYCSNGVFKKTLVKIEEYFQNFNFDFKLELKTEKTGNKTEFPFAFKVLDSRGIERDLEEGLSEGELQVLSLCFFFAFLDIQESKDEKILIFDDPITSLDNSNLNHLVNLIAKEERRFSQTFIFTHHRTFFKFLRKKFKTGKKDSNLGYEYNIIRNKKEFGGSFICKSESKSFKDKLEKFETDIYNAAQKGSPINIELKIVEYGQYLRYEVEKFIKNDLLFWHADINFSVAIEGLKETKEKIKDEDLDKINEIYSFCNWTTSHVDVGDDHGLQQLKDKIIDFIKIAK